MFSSAQNRARGRLAECCCDRRAHDDGALRGRLWRGQRHELLDIDALARLVVSHRAENVLRHAPETGQRQKLFAVCCDQRAYDTAMALLFTGHRNRRRIRKLSAGKGLFGAGTQFGDERFGIERKLPLRMPAHREPLAERLAFVNDRHLR